MGRAAKWDLGDEDLTQGAQRWGRSVAGEEFQFSLEGISRKDSRAGAQLGVWGHYLVGVFRAWEGRE